MKKVALGGLFLFLFSCSTLFDKKICKVGDKVLYEKDLNTIVRLFYSEFSEEEAKNLAIEQWANQQRIKLEIESTSPDIFLANTLQTENELMNLNLFELENKFIQNHLDTVITESEIQDYYNKHRENYKSQSYIVRALYIKIPDTMGATLGIDDYYLLNNDKDREEIKKYANLYATNFYFEEKRWIFFDDLVREIPIAQKEKNELIINRGKAKYIANGETHYINILDYRTKSISSPLEAERNVIRRHVITRKINKLRENAKETILQNVKEKYPITYY